MADYNWTAKARVRVKSSGKYEEHNFGGVVTANDRATALSTVKGYVAAAEATLYEYSVTDLSITDEVQT